MKKQLYTVFFLLISLNCIHAQNCNPLTPVFDVDLTGQPNGTWLSPSISRDGKCCGVTGPDVCIQFNLTLDTGANSISFDIYSGAIPGGSMYYQINCGPQIAVGEPVCLSGTGPHIITFCKPGNNPNEYTITSNSPPQLNGTPNVTQACQGLMVVTGLANSTIQWTSVPSNPVYNSYLNCTTGCDSAVISPPANTAPAYIDYQVCGDVLAGCFPYSFCDTLRVNFFNDLAVTINPANPTICFGGTNATLTANGSGGLTPYTYLWSSGDTTSTITKGPGIYSVQVFDQMNCSFAYDTVTVTGFASAINANAGPDSTLCLNDQSFQLNGNVIIADGGQWFGSGIFSPSDTSLNARFYPSAAQINDGYADLQLVSTGNYNCPADTDYIHLIISENPLPAITGPLQVCIYETVQYITPYVSGNNYVWSVSGGIVLNVNQNIIDVKWTTTGSNQISVIETNSANCDSISTITIDIMPKPTPDITGSQMVCNFANEIYSIVNPVTGNNYQWTIMNGIFTDSTGNSVIAGWRTAGMGNISVLETNTFGCDSTISLTVNIIGQPVPVITGLDTVCNYQTATYSVTPDSTHIFIWTVNGGNIISQNNNVIEIYWTSPGNGTIILNEINQTLCDSTTSFNVVILDQPVPIITGPLLTCSNVNTVYLVSGINPGETIDWYINGGIILGATNVDSVQVLWQNAGIGELRINVVNQSGCDSTVTIMVSVLDGAAPELKGPSQACVSDTCVYSVPFVQGHTYRWHVIGGIVLARSNSNSIRVYWQTNGNGIVLLSEITPAGCDSAISMNVSVNALPVPVLNGVPLICENETTVFNTTSDSSDTFLWIINGGIIINGNVQSSVTCNWPTIGQHTLTLIETNPFGCVSMAAIPVEVVPKPAVNIAGNLTGCQNTNSAYNVNELPGITYQYSVNGGLISSYNAGNFQVQWTGYGNNSVTVNAIDNLTGCTTQKILDVNVEPLPQPLVNATNFSGCPPLSISFQNNQVNSMYNYTWSFGAGANSNQANPTHTFNNSGVYQVNVVATNNTGCIDSASAVVNVFPVPSSSFNILNYGETVYSELQQVYLTNSSNGAISYSWDFGNGDTSNIFEPLYTYNKPGVYTINLEVVNSNGCRHSMMRNIEVIVPEDVYVPNTFTPNDDSNNDYFSVKYKNITSATVYIFDRWGEMIYESNDMDFKWTGTFKDRMIQNDVYVYMIKAIGYHGTVINKTGKLTVLY